MTTRGSPDFANTPRKTGLVLCAIHLFVVLALAAWIYLASAHNGESPMYWMFLILADLPVSLLFGPLTNLLGNASPVSWLSGLMGDWSNYLFPLLFFATIGSTWWFCLGWGLGHLVNVIRRRQRLVPESKNG